MEADLAKTPVRPTDATRHDEARTQPAHTHARISSGRTGEAWDAGWEGPIAGRATSITLTLNHLQAASFLSSMTRMTSPAADARPRSHARHPRPQPRQQEASRNPSIGPRPVIPCTRRASDEHDDSRHSRPCLRTTISPCALIVPAFLSQASFPPLPRHAYTPSTVPPASTLQSLYLVGTRGLNSSSLPC